MSLNTKTVKLTSTLVLTFALGACSSGPKTFEGNTEATPQIENTEQSLQNALKDQTDVFAPTSYHAARRALDEAKEERADNSSNEKILKEVEEANGLIATANQKAQVNKTALPGVADARLAAINVGAHDSQKEKFADVDEDLMDFSAKAEDGKLSSPQRTAKKLVADYNKLLVEGTLAQKLGAAEAAIKAAKDEGAEDNAPKSWGVANKYYKDAVVAIKGNPLNMGVIDPASQRAQFEAEKLLRVTRKAKAAGGAKAEAVVLQAEAQTQFIYNQDQKLAQVENEKAQIESQVGSLQGVKDLQDKIAVVSKKFNKSEAEVYQQNKAVIVRLKGIKFANNKAVIPTASFETLKKVQEAIQVFDAPKVRIEGHTDATGNAAVNMPLSKERAEAVKTYLTANLSLPADGVEAAGYGSQRPITSNKTPVGRAQNRRIDIVIQE